MNNTARNILIGTGILGAVAIGLNNAPLPDQVKIPFSDVVAQGAIVNLDGSETQVYAYKGVKRPKEVNEIISKRTQNSQTFSVSDNEYRTVFYTGDVFYLDESTDEWYDLESTTEVISGLIDTAYAQTTDTFYPGADAYIAYTGGSGVSWDTVHDAGAGTSGSSANITHAVESVHIGTQYQILRTFYHFDTSSLPDTASISGVLFKNYVSVKINTDNDGDDFIVVIQSLVSTDTTFTTGDYDLCGSINSPTEGSNRIDLGSITTSAYNTWTLDSTGRGWVSLTGYTKLCMREGHDVVDNAIANDTRSLVDSRTVDYTGTTYDPKLEVTYTVPEVESTTGQSIIWFD